VRTYADYLGLDAARVIERYKTQIAGRTDDLTPTITVIDDDENRRLPQGWKIIVGVVFLLLAYGAYHLVVPAADRMLAPPVSPVPAQLAPRPARTAPRSAPPVRKAQTAPAAATTVPSGQATAVPGATAPLQQQAAIPQGQVYGKQHQDARVVLRMRQTTRVLVQGPNGMVFINRTLNAGDSYMVPNQTGLTLTTADAGAVEIDLDGVAMGTAGSRGQIGETVSLDPQAVADHFSNKKPG
jgi:cytoskeleton protein RodZ